MSELLEVALNELYIKDLEEQNGALIKAHDEQVDVIMALQKLYAEIDTEMNHLTERLKEAERALQYYSDTKAYHECELEQGSIARDYLQKHKQPVRAEE